MICPFLKVRLVVQFGVDQCALDFASNLRVGCVGRPDGGSHRYVSQQVDKVTERAAGSDCGHGEWKQPISTVWPEVKVCWATSEAEDLTMGLAKDSPGSFYHQPRQGSSAFSYTAVLYC